MAHWMGKEKNEIKLCPLLLAHRPEGEAHCRLGRCEWWNVQERPNVKGTTEMCSITRTGFPQL